MFRIEFRTKKFNWYVSNFILYWNGKVGLFLGWRIPKVPIISKNCAALNFVQKSHRVHVSISRRSGARGSKDCHFKHFYLTHQRSLLQTLHDVDSALQWAWNRFAFWTFSRCDSERGWKSGVDRSSSEYQTFSFR